MTHTRIYAVILGLFLCCLTVSAEKPQRAKGDRKAGVSTLPLNVVENLPLNGRNFTQLLTLTPGATPVSTVQSSGFEMPVIEYILSLPGKPEMDKAAKKSKKKNTLPDRGSLRLSLPPTRK